MEKYNKTVGKFGEDAAEKYLKKKHYQIVAKNFLIRGGEIDIIARKGEYIIFVEVKTRSGKEFGAPAEAVTFHKRERMIKAASVFLQSYGEAYARFDIIEVFACADGDKLRLERLNHIENAFM